MPADVAADTATHLRTREFLGHPLGLSVLFGTEMWERFCYYGMRALLTFYMVDYLFVGDMPHQILGYGTVKGALESVFGTLPPQPLAAQVYGIYTALVYLTGIAGGWAADAFLGQKRAVLLGAATMAAGEFLLMWPSLFFLGLLTLILGNGFFKPNISTQVGGLYRPGDARIDRAYSIFYVGINLGALIAPLVCGPLGHAPAGHPPTWHWGFFAAGIGMLIGLAIFVAGQPALPPDVRKRRQLSEAAAGQTTTHLTGEDRKVIAALCFVAFANLFWWGCYEQQGISIALMAQDYTRLPVLPLLGQAQPELVQAFNPFFIFSLTPIVVALWAQQSRRRTEPSSVTKMAIGSALAAAAFAILIVPALTIDAGGKTSILWLLLSLAVLTVGELYLSPVGLALFSKAAPAKVASMMMGVNFLSNFAGNYMAGFLGSFWSRMPKTHFFIMITAILAVTTVAIAWLSRMLSPMLTARENAARL